MQAYLVTGNPGSGKSTLAAELCRRGMVAVDTDDLAFWADSAGTPVAQPPDPDDKWLLAHRWVWSRSRLERFVAESGSQQRSVFFCGIARNQEQMLDLFDQVFILMIDEQTQLARLAAESPVRTGAARQQIRDGRHVFQAQMLALGAIPLDGTASPKVVADRLLAHLRSGS